MRPETTSRRIIRRTRRDARKTALRTAAYLSAALRARSPARDQVVVAWGLVAAALWAVVAGTGSDASAEAPLLIVLSGVLIAVSAAICAIDSRWGLIPDALNGFILAFGIVRASLLGGPGSVWSALAGTVAIYATGWALGRLYLACRGFEGFGGGDVKLVAATVPWVGVGGLPGMMIIAVGSAFVGMALMRRDGPIDRHDAIPFGPHLCLGLAWTAILAPWSG